jgi:aminopeptidase
MANSHSLLLPFDPSAQPQHINGVSPQQLWKNTPSGDKAPKVGTTRAFFGVPTGYTTAISSLGDKFAEKKGDERRELIRKAVGAGIKSLKRFDGLAEVLVDASLDPHAAGMY